MRDMKEAKERRSRDRVHVEELGVVGFVEVDVGVGGVAGLGCC